MTIGLHAPRPPRTLAFAIFVLFSSCKRASEMQPKQPGAPSPRLWEEGGVGQDPILEFQVVGSESGARRTPQLWLVGRRVSDPSC